MTGMDDTTFLDEVYATALDTRKWESVIARFADMLGGSSGFLSAFDLVTGKGAVILSRSDPEVVERYEKYYAAINPLNNVTDPESFLRGWRPAIVTDEDKLPKSDFIRTEYYNDFVLPNESHSTMMIRLARHGSTPQVLNINRSRNQGSFQAADLELAARFHPHFIRAFGLGRTLAEERPLDDDLSLFSGSPHGLFVTRSDGLILRANPSAEALLTGAGALRVIGGRLTSDQPGARRTLKALMAVAGSGEADMRSGGTMKLAQPGGGAPLSISVAPMRRGAHPVFASERTVVVCVTDPARTVATPTSLLRELFGLTAAEAGLAVALVESGDLPTAASSIGIASNTARVHLARVYDKTGVNRQVALVNLILKCAGPALGVPVPS